MKKAETGRKARWRQEDLIAFECALARDSNEEWAVLKDRDVRIGETEDVRAQENRRSILYQWLRQRQQQDPGIQQAAESVNHSIVLAGQLLCVAGFIIGVSAATMSLAYTGDAPINVSAFFSIFILLQLVLAIVMILAFGAPNQLREWLVFGPLFRFIRWLLEALLDRMQGMLSGRHREKATALAGTSRRFLSQHGSLSKWMVFRKIQASALFFNLGALSALLFAVLFSDRAFGWQTTLEISGETVHFLVRLIALPWSWFYGEGLGFPDLSQIEGSRIVLKDGIQALTNQDLASWWRFLAMGIIFYGVLPRGFFYFLGKWKLRRSLAGYVFQNAASERIMQRLFPSKSGFVAQEVNQDAIQDVPEFPQSDSPLPNTETNVRCLLPEELQKSVDCDVLRLALARHWNLPEASVKIEVYESGGLVPRENVHLDNQQVAVIHESWMPPIKEHERQLKSLRDALPKDVLIRLVLLGVPDENKDSIKIESEGDYLKPWDALVRRLGDPYLMLERTGS